MYPAIIDSGRAAHSAVQMIEDRLTERESGVIDGIQFTVPELKAIARPIYPHETAFIIGHSRNGKSFVVKKVLYEETQKLYREHKTDNVNVIVTWEEPAEILAMNWMSVLSGISSTKMLKGLINRTELDELKQNVVVKVGQYPIYIIGMSANRGKDGIRRKVDLSMGGVDQCLEWIMNKQRLDMRVLVYDYLQRIPNDSSKSQAQHVMNAVDWVKDTGLWTGASVLCATQAKQSVLDRPIPMPKLYDSEWSANVAQSGDVVYSVFMPKTHFANGTFIEKFAAYRDMKVDNNMQFLNILKQKGDVDGYVCAMEIQPDFLKWRMHTMWYDTEWAQDNGHRFNPNRPFV